MTRRALLAFKVAIRRVKFTAMSLRWLVCAIAACLAGAQSSLFGSQSHLDWGTYRPNLYFGLRTRSPSSPLTGLIWFGIQDYQSIGKARHSCEQDDGVRYNWIKHDARSAGIQIVEDPQNNVRMSMSFLKSPGGANGQYFRHLSCQTNTSGRRKLGCSRQRRTNRCW